MYTLSYFSGESIQELGKFLKALPCCNAPRMPVGSEALDDLVVTEIEKEIEKVKVSCQGYEKK